MKLSKNELKEMKSFLEYLINNTTLKERKSFVTVGGVDFLLIINSIWCLIDENKDIDFILQSFVFAGLTTVLLITMIVIYFDMYKEDKIIKQRIRK